MYYENKKISHLGIGIIIIFLMIIVTILISLINRIDINYLEIENEETETTEAEAVTDEFDVQNLMKNSIYSVVRDFKIKRKINIDFCSKCWGKIRTWKWSNNYFRWIYFG